MTARTPAVRAEAQQQNAPRGGQGRVALGEDTGRLGTPRGLAWGRRGSPRGAGRCSGRGGGRGGRKGEGRGLPREPRPLEPSRAEPSRGWGVGWGRGRVCPWTAGWGAGAACAHACVCTRVCVHACAGTRVCAGTPVGAGMPTRLSQPPPRTPLPGGSPAASGCPGVTPAPTAVPVAQPVLPPPRRHVSLQGDPGAGTETLGTQPASPRAATASPAGPARGVPPAAPPPPLGAAGFLPGWWQEAPVAFSPPHRPDHTSARWGAELFPANRLCQNGQAAAGAGPRGLVGASRPGNPPAAVGAGSHPVAAPVSCPQVCGGARHGARAPAAEGRMPARSDTPCAGAWQGPWVLLRSPSLSRHPQRVVPNPWCRPWFWGCCRWSCRQDRR